MSLHDHFIACDNEIHDGFFIIIHFVTRVWKLLCILMRKKIPNPNCFWKILIVIEWSTFYMYSKYNTITTLVFDSPRSANRSSLQHKTWELDFICTNLMWRTIATSCKRQKSAEENWSLLLIGFKPCLMKPRLRMKSERHFGRQRVGLRLDLGLILYLSLSACTRTAKLCGL